MPRQYLVVISMCLCALFVSFLRCVKHISNTTVIIESDRFDLNFSFLSHAGLIFFPVNESDLLIRLKLNGTFATFHSTRFLANTDTRQEGVVSIMITLIARWDPSNTSYAQQANVLIDVAGQVIENNTSIPKLVIDDRPTTKNEIEDIIIDFDCHLVQINHEKDRKLQM